MTTADAVALVGYLVFLLVWATVMLWSALTGHYKGATTIVIAAVVAFIPFTLIVWLA